MQDSAKSYILTFEERLHYLYARIEASAIDRETALQYIHELGEKVAAAGVKRLMLDRRIPAVMPDADAFFSTGDLMKAIGRVKVAFVNPYPENTEALDFVVLVGINRGANFALFDNEKAAEEWLLKGVGPSVRRHTAP